MHMTHCPIGQIAHGESSYGTTHQFIHLVIQIVYCTQGSHPARHHGHAHGHAHAHVFSPPVPSSSVGLFKFSLYGLAPCLLLDSFRVGVINRLAEGTWTRRLWQLQMVSWYVKRSHRPASDG